MGKEVRPLILRKRPSVQLYHGDCMGVLRGLRTNSVHAVVTDPPYGISYQWGSNPKIINDGRPFIWWLWDSARVLKSGGALVCFCRWDVQHAFRSAIELAGLRVRGQWVWDRKWWGIPNPTTLLPRHDVMWFATKGRFKFPGKIPPSLIQVPSILGPKRVHPTEKPAELMRQLVRFVTPHRGVVLDPCMGSGATGAAVVDGFGFTGIEIDRKFYRAAVKRLRRVIKERRRGHAVE